MFVCSLADEFGISVVKLPRATALDCYVAIFFLLLLLRMQFLTSSLKMSKKYFRKNGRKVQMNFIFKNECPAAFRKLKCVTGDYCCESPVLVLLFMTSFMKCSQLISVESVYLLVTYDDRCPSVYLPERYASRVR